MDSDDPIVHSKFFKFIKSKGKSLLEHYWGSEPPTINGPKSVEMKGKGEEAKNPEDLSATEIEGLLKKVKAFITQTIITLEELSGNMRSLMLIIVQEKKSLLDLKNAFDISQDQETDPELKEVYNQMGEMLNSSKANQDRLACDTDIRLMSKQWKNLHKYSDFKSLSKTYALLNQYQKVDRAIDRLLYLAMDVEDLKGLLLKFKEEPDTLETYKSEYHHYLNLLRRNFEFLKEDSGKMQAKEDKNLKSVIQEYFIFQKEYFEHQNTAVNA
mmetsp:Transcript_22902/g.25422  ORF Transcript_22902/g.25422 Transcript_22902/m.25422 type:complete len:270 (+) Transcript_22902:523-1332(+)|eukprot:CAMPEP_0205829808 /NCGR_PEP_ID=MMETSP0206-20130828/39281_1 /ASSEMBLY_ACC=CAM_ASM_000279 /TAXON_ID=36767 /ORGANISM="Euplotes focardii, Strain TN1" /LENGTH=269 /DNA_ID=CAMNT_0053132891 /DNA_START=514 /DNA_END=1323 /DNA_ORIENTATION=+